MSEYCTRVYNSMIYQDYMSEYCTRVYNNMIYQVLYV